MRCDSPRRCVRGIPDRLADRIAARIVDLACGRDDHALVGVEVAIHRNVVFIDGRIAAGTGSACAVDEEEIVRARARGVPRRGIRRVGVGDVRPRSGSPGGAHGPVPRAAGDDERAVRHVSDDQAIAVGHAVQGARAGYRPLEQALATDVHAAIECAAPLEAGAGPRSGRQSADRRPRPGARRRVGVGPSLPGAEWIALTRAVRDACETVAREYVEAGELEPLHDVDWLINGAGAFEIGGPEGDNGLSGKKLVAQAYGTAVPIGGGATFGKDPRKVDPRGQRMAREMALELVRSGKAREATVWLAGALAMWSRGGSR